MADKRDGAMVADNGTEQELSRRGDHAAPLSDGLIGVVGKLAVKEALTQVPPEETRLQSPVPEAPPRFGFPMGKPLQLIKGAHYFMARCPVSGDILEAIPDEQNGEGAPLAGEWRVSCADCDTTHVFDLAHLKPERVAPVSRMDDADGWHA